MPKPEAASSRPEASGCNSTSVLSSSYLPAEDMGGIRHETLLAVNTTRYVVH
ncbi:hypothetical protein L486_04949 [Kwoniella mangroviensis CBS 10435]|uniref:Uncharacterized protein n=1 Tax=Kwoniella mangroviensis CBS 10435 TaxID=1331196 RepID=A0A1B9IPS6_9TREE|nr:uncharacterized protein I203_00312 [Kwoniella mangroviensis CBS 8507]OCF57491.1 hypothetical protein L486_04949 [Kwoniella mangroviensis CBS 10435]OCF70180.1 hypothetical protein I203_00312 [Kwoniella mangroviensis CBS 8507]OCF75957.1 hypothetical protein I204_03254 [Kwoniella mangroviensis CBS 8886]